MGYTTQMKHATKDLNKYLNANPTYKAILQLHNIPIKGGHMYMAAILDWHSKSVLAQPSGRWMMKLEDIDGLTPQQIQDKFDLPEIPTHITDVNPPQGSKIRTGTVNSGNFGGNGGGTQFELRSTIPNESFTNRRPL